MLRGERSRPLDERWAVRIRSDDAVAAVEIRVLSREIRARVRSAALKEVRREIEEAGAGTAVPAFNQNTRQRTPRI
jgi:hypothetical protein